jgi:hypothetical protein
MATAVAAIMALREFRLKQKSAQAELDVRMMRLFAETMRIAQSRGEAHLSEKCVEQLFSLGVVTKDDFADLDDKEKFRELFNKLRMCAIAAPESRASQHAAIAGIAALAQEYEILRWPARAGFEAIREAKGQDAVVREALAYLDKIETPRPRGASWIENMWSPFASDSGSAEEQDT